MKKLFFIPVTMFLATLLIIGGCQKSVTESIDEVAGKTNDKPKNECRPTEIDVTLGNYKYHYNSQGLCDEWEITNYAILYKQEYNESGRLVKAKQFVENELTYTVDFFYTGDKVTKEIWYYGNSSDVYDEVHYIFNSRGENTRMESFLNDYYTVNTFDASGNPTAFDFYVGGSPVYSGRYSYNYHYRNPYNEIKGIEYDFPFLNAVSLRGRFFASGEKFIAYDENGNATVWYDYDAQQAPWQVASHNFPATAVYHDAVTNDWVSYTMQYENCGPANVNATKSSGGSATVNKVMVNRMQLLMKGNLKSIRKGIK